VALRIVSGLSVRGAKSRWAAAGGAYDNAMCESFFATLECELLERRRFTSKIEAKMACSSFIEGWYNPVRLHSALGYRSPMAYEAAMEAVTTEP
jgi:putative transposase